MNALDLLTRNESLNLPLSKRATFFRPTWAEIDTDAFSFNLKQIRNVIGPSVQLMAVLKADAYGHGATDLARVSLDHGVQGFGVSSLEEGIALRDAKIKGPILILGSIYPLKNFSIAMEYGLTPTVASLEAAQALDQESINSKQITDFHLKIDTGMGRIGVSPSGAKVLLERVKEAKNIRLRGIYSHLASAETDKDFSHKQLQNFQTVVSMAEDMGFKNLDRHICNSAALFLENKFHLDMVRPGLALYGVAPATMPAHFKIQSVLSWYSQIIFLKKVPMNTPISYGATYRTSRDSEIATIPVGYADGLPRLSSNRGHVLIRGRKCPIVGRVTMDHTMIDVTGVGAAVGDPVVLIGSQNQQAIGALDWAAWAETNSYEILCGISKRVPRVLTGVYADR